MQDGLCKIHSTETILRESGYEGVSRNELVQLWLQDLPRPSRASLCWAPRRNHTVHALVREIMTTVNCQNVLRIDYESEVYVLPGDKENSGIV